MYDQDKNKERDREALIAAIEAEMSDILAKDHGMEGVRVRFNRDTGRATLASGEAIPDRLVQELMPIAAKRAIIKRVREQERREQ